MSGVFVLQGDNKLVEMEEQVYESEDLLQSLLEDYPSLLAGKQIKPDSPRRWLLISREAGIPDKEKGAGRWSVDHLFIDQDGIPTLVEVKRSTDTRIRREVIGQLLEYAANAIVYWPVNKLKEMFELTCEEKEEESDVKLSEFIGSELEIDEFWDVVGSNLQSGKIRLLFVADEIPTELQRIVEFLNVQMTPAEVLAVEIKQFVGDKIKTLVPRIIGQTVEAQDKKDLNLKSKQWDESSFMERLDDKEKIVAGRILEWANKNRMRIWWGKGAKDGSFTPILDHNGTDYYPIAVRTGYKNPHIQIQFDRLSKRPPFDSDDLRAEFLDKLNEIEGVDMPSTSVSKYPSLRIRLLNDEKELNKLMNTLDWFTERIRTNGPAST